MAELQQYCTFVLADNHFGIEVEKVHEVIKYRKLTPVPLSEYSVKGLINLRGQIVTAIDLRHRLSMPELPEDRNPMNVVIRLDDELVSLLVDEIGDVVELDANSIDAPPETIDSATRDLFRGVFQLEDRLLLILDTEHATTLA